MKRILIEFFSKRTPENLISLLKENYQGVCFLYFKGTEAPSEKTKQQITKVVREIFNFAPEFHPVSHRSIHEILNAFDTVLTPDREYVVDITGGNEAFIAAAGIFLERKPAVSVCLHRYDVYSGKKLFSYPDSKETEPVFPKHLDVPQMLSLNGTPPLSAPRYTFTYGVLSEEILRLWNAVKRIPKEWNNFCSLPCNVLKGDEIRLQKCMDPKQAKTGSYRVVADRLTAAGIMTNAEFVEKGEKNYMEFCLNVPAEAQFLYEKAGNLLELYTALAAFDAGVFHDVRVGVTVDWNGKQAPHWKPDPRNEIDLVLMHHDLPVLASCKNTYPQNEYLYEIMTMARHYGGYFARAMMLSSGNASPTVRERAKEMGIILIDGIRKKSFEELVLLFRKYFS